MSDKTYATLKEAQNAADEAGAVVTLLGSGAVRLAWLQAHTSFLKAANLLLADDWTTEAEEFVADTRMTVEAMVDLMREDLEVRLHGDGV